MPYPSPWSTVAERLADAACRALTPRLSGTQPIELQLELGGRFPRTASTWAVDPQSPRMALDLTRSTILRTLAYQPVPFDGVVGVRARGHQLCGIHVRVDRDG